MPRIRLTIELFDTTNANEAQSTDDALIRRADRTREEIQRVAMDLLERGQYYVRWDVVGPVGRMIYDDVEWDLNEAMLGQPPHPDSAPADADLPSSTPH